MSTLAADYTSTNRILRNHTVIEILAQLIVRDEELLTVQLLDLLRGMANSPTFNDEEADAAIAAVANTVVSLINSDGASGGQINAESAVFVAAAKHGSPNIVNALITNGSAKIDAVIAERALNEAQQNDQDAIVKRLTQDRTDTNTSLSRPRSAKNQNTISDKGSIVTAKDTSCNANMFPRSPHVRNQTGNSSPPDDNEKAAATATAAQVDIDVKQHEDVVNKARAQGDFKLVELLALIDFRAHSVYTNVSGLPLASANGKTTTVKMLLADPTIDPTAYKNIALRLAIFNGHTNIVEIFLQDRRVAAAVHFNELIQLASKYGHLTTVQLLLSDPRVNPASEYNSALRLASQHGHIEAARLLLSDSRVNPAAIDNDAIQLASRNGHTELVRLFLSDTRVNAGAGNNQAIRFASQFGHLTIIKLLLLDPRVNPAADDNAAIGLASQNGHTESIMLLLSDIRVNPGANNNTAIQLASENGHVESVQLLLSDSRVNPAVHGNKAIRLASKNGHAETVKTLLFDPRVDPTPLNNYAMCNACENGHPETVAVLLGDPRVKLATNRIRTLIRSAVVCGFVDIVAILLAQVPLSAGSSFELISLCATHGQSQILKIILQHMQPPTSDDQLTTTVRDSFQKAFNNNQQQFVLELVTQSANIVTARVVANLLNENRKVLSVQLASMHTDILRVLLDKFGSDLEEDFCKKVMSCACRIGSVCVVQELLDSHHAMTWTVDDFNVAAFRGNISVLRLLGLSQYGGCNKLAETPPLNRVCARMVLGEMHRNSSFVLMWCLKKKITSRIMAKVLDVLRDLISGDFLRYVMK